MKTIATPIKIPMTTHTRRPKIDVCLESCVLRNVPSKIDIAGKWVAGDTGSRLFRREMREKKGDFAAKEDLIMRF